MTLLEIFYKLEVRVSVFVDKAKNLNTSNSLISQSQNSSQTTDI